MDDLRTYLKRFRRRIRIYDAWELFQRGLWLSLLTSLGIQLSGRIIPIENLRLLTLLPPIVWAVFAGCFHSFRSISLDKTARRIDLELGLFERLSTSLALETTTYRFIGALVSAQKRDALSTAVTINISPAFPIKISPRAWLKTVLAAALVIGLIFIPNPMDAILEQRKAVAQEALTQAEKIDEFLEELEKAEELEPNEAEEMQRMLAELAEELRSNPGDLDQGLAEISEVEREIQTRREPNAALQAASFESLVEQLQALAGQTSDNRQDQMEAAQQALQALAEKLANMDTPERLEIASAVAKLSARASQSGNEQLSQALSRLAKAVMANDQESILNSSQEIVRAIAQTQQSQHAQAMLSEIHSLLQSSRQALAQSGQSTAQGSPVPGNQSQSTGGGGTNAPVLPPGTSQGQASSPQGNKPIGGEDDAIGSGTIPRQSGSYVGDQLYIPGIDTGQGEFQVSTGDNPIPGHSNPALVPYDQVYYQYLNAAVQAFGQNYIPLNMLNYVQQYFLNLEPQ